MGNFKDFDLDLKVSKADGNGDTLAASIFCTVGTACQSLQECPTIGYDCETMFCTHSCKGSCDCSPSDMTACRQMPQEKNDIRRC